MPNPQEAELEVLIRARYPLICLVSWEETRAERMLAALAESHHKRLFLWTFTQGFREVGKNPDASTKDPQAALDFLEKSQESAIFVLKDFHPYLQDPGVIRRLRDLVDSLKSSYKSLILLSPVLVIPVELEKDLTVIDYDLPGQAELWNLLKEVAGAAQDGAKFSVNLETEDVEKLIHAAMGMTLSEAENALAKAIVLDSKLGAADVDVILQEKKQIIRKSRLLEFFEAKEEFGGIGGLGLLKDWIHKRGMAFSDKARQFGLPQPRGILLLGVQGCGKSLTCKAVASLWRLPLLRLDMGAVFGGIVGQSEENMRRAIRTAESVAPCVLWLDEIEKGLSGTQSSNFSDAGTTARVFSTFLTWLQEKTKPVFVAATANSVNMLPPELLRKGRLDEIFFVDLPSAAERRDIFVIHIKKRGRDPEKFDLDGLCRASVGYSGAEIEQAVVEGLYEAFNAGRELSDEDLKKTLASSVPLSRTMKEDIDGLRSWAASRARPASTPDAPAQQAAGGFTRKVEVPDVRRS
ncbi:MAG: AAA family ATPase [Elusimicrobia bacterium]|nr:AAA family ATPase [Elusimicrobiota bacterium]